MSDLNEMAEALELSRTAPDALDRAAGIVEAERISCVAAVLASMQGDGSDDCEECGIDIPRARREAAPWAVCCVDCQSLREIRHG